MRTIYYIGVYVECKNPLVTETKKEPGCVNSNCPRYHVNTTGVYCSICRKPLDFYEVHESVSSIDTWEIVEGIAEAMMPAYIEGRHNSGVDIWIANYRKPETHIVLDETSLVELTDDMKRTHLQNFADKFKPSLDAMGKFYGPENMVVKWGVVADTN